MGQVVASTGRATLRQPRLPADGKRSWRNENTPPEIDQPRDARTDLIARKHPIDQTIVLTQRVKSIELFQSPRPGGSAITSSPRCDRRGCRLGVDAITVIGPACNLKQEFCRATKPHPAHDGSPQLRPRTTW